MPTQSQYNVSKQLIRNQTVKIDLLNFQFQNVDELSGNTISGAITIDSNSDIRSVCNIGLVVTDSSFDIQSGSKIWLNKYVQIWVGIDDFFTGEIAWFNYGIFLIDAPNWKYDAVTNILTFQGLDLMSKMTGLRNGYLEGIPTLIPKGSNVREAMIGAVQQFGGFNNYVIDECTLDDGTVQEVPYDIEIPQGSTVFDIIKALRDIVPNYEVFFNADGVFIYQKIPTGENETVVADNDVFDDNVIGEDINTDFSSVKNIIEVFGHSHDVKHYSTVTTVSSNVINLTIPSLTALAENNLIGWTATSNVSGNIQINVNSLGSKNLVNSKGEFITSLEKDVYYVAIYQSNNTWLFLGHQQSYAIAKDNNPDSPFFIGGESGEIRISKYGGEYDNIQTDELALLRANFELYQATRLHDTIAITCVPIHWLEVNTLISYSKRDSMIQEQYIIKSISVDLSESGTQTIVASKYYPLYPTI